MEGKEKGDGQSINGTTQNVKIVTHRDNKQSLVFHSIGRNQTGSAFLIDLHVEIREKTHIFMPTSWKLRAFVSVSVCPT